MRYTYTEWLKATPEERMKRWEEDPQCFEAVKNDLPCGFNLITGKRDLPIMGEAQPMQKHPVDMTEITPERRRFVSDKMADKGICEALIGYAEDEGIPTAIQAAEEWRDALEALCEVASKEQRKWALALLETVNVGITILVSGPENWR